jgi:hypothetical protein
MPTDNYDASLVMERKRNATIRAYNTNLATYQNNVNYNLARKEQPTVQSAQVVAQRTGQGCMGDTSMPGYIRRVVGITKPDNDSDYDLYNPIYDNDAVLNPADSQ